MNQNAEMAQISSDRSRCPEQIKDPPQIRPWQDRTGHFSYYIIGKSIQSSGNTAGTDAYSGKCSPHVSRDHRNCQGQRRSHGYGHRDHSGALQQDRWFQHQALPQLSVLALLA